MTINLELLAKDINALGIDGIWTDLNFPEQPGRFLIVYGGVNHPRMSILPSGKLRIEHGIPCWPVIDVIRRHITEAAK